jgi:hypothetical protein
LKIWFSFGFLVAIGLLFSTQFLFSQDIDPAPIFHQKNWLYLGYSYSPSFPFGGTIGALIEKWGGYFSLTAHPHDLYKYDKLLGDGYYYKKGSSYWLVETGASEIIDQGETTNTSWSMIFGVHYRLFRNIFFNFGIGPEIIQNHHLFSLDGNDKWVREKNSSGAFTGQAGLTWAFGAFFISANYQHLFRDNSSTFHISVGFAGPIDTSAEEAYKESVKRQLEEQERQKEQQEKIEYELQLRTNFEAAYQNALNQNGVSGLAAFILDGRRLLGPNWYFGYKLPNGIKWDDDIIEDCRKEIARRLTNNQNITFVRIGGIGNPYGFDKNVIYNCTDYIRVSQWRTDGSLFCLLDGDELIIDKVPDITKIGNSIRNAYLQYKGTKEVTFVSGRSEMIAVFDLLYYF